MLPFSLSNPTLDALWLDLLMYSVVSSNAYTEQLKLM